MTGLPPYLRRLRDRLRTATNHLDTLERLEIAQAWGAANSDEKRAHAYKTIEKCVLDAAEIIGVQPSEKQLYHDIISRLREENDRLTAANVVARENRAA